MKKSRRAGVAWIALAAALSEGCSSQHGEYGSGAYVMGAIFLLIGLALAVGLIMGNN